MSSSSNSSASTISSTILSAPLPSYTVLGVSSSVITVTQDTVCTLTNSCTTPGPSPAPAPDNDRKDGPNGPANVGLIVGLVVGCTLFVVIVTSVVCYLKKRHGNEQMTNSVNPDNEAFEKAKQMDNKKIN